MKFARIIFANLLRKKVRLLLTIGSFAVALFFAREKTHGPAQWADIGGYLQTVSLLARGHGLHTCPQQATARPQQ